MPAAGHYGKELVPMVTYSELFTFVIMICAVITLVYNLTHKKQRPRSGKVRRYLQYYLPAARLHLAGGSLVKYIICISLQIVKFEENKKPPGVTSTERFHRYYSGRCLGIISNPKPYYITRTSALQVGVIFTPKINIKNAKQKRKDDLYGYNQRTSYCLCIHSCIYR